jgi:integrase
VGTVFKKTFTKPLPMGAEIIVRKGERLARWKNAKGKARTALLTTGKDGSDRVIIESPFFIAKYRDGAGLVREIATGCKDETAARQVLADLERRAELVLSNVMTASEAAIGDHQATPLAVHFAAYLAHLEAAGTCTVYRANAERQLNRLAADCSFGRLSDLNRAALERWLVTRAREGMGARTRNSYLVTATCFANWCADPNVQRLAGNPFAGIVKANEKADPRRQRRAMTEAELLRLLPIARSRPLREALTVRKGPRKGERYADVRPEVRARLDLVGRERALIYKTLVLSGLRKGELASLTVGQLYLDGPVCYAALDAADEKNGEGSDIPLRDDLADDLRAWLADKLDRLQQAALTDGSPIPARLPPDAPVFAVPSQLCKILDRDLQLAGIAKRDDRGRTLDVHALRTTFGTLLSKGGVMPRTAQAAMRHSKIELTMGVYTDPKLLDVRGALDTLPALSLDGETAERQAMRATGTDSMHKDLGQSLLAPTLAPTVDFSGHFGAIPVKMAADDKSREGGRTLDVTASGDKTKQPLTIAVSGCPKVELTGIEPVTSRMPF